MSDSDESAFFEFQATEKSASPRTLANYRDALAAYRKWRGDRFANWRTEEADDFRDYLFALMKDASAPIVIRGRHWGGFRMGYKA